MQGIVSGWMPKLTLTVSGTLTYFRIVSIENQKPTIVILASYLKVIKLSFKKIIKYQRSLQLNFIIEN